MSCRRCEERRVILSKISCSSVLRLDLYPGCTTSCLRRATSQFQDWIFVLFGSLFHIDGTAIFSIRVNCGHADTDVKDSLRYNGLYAGCQRFGGA